ncbi:MAG: hypothetical protein AB7K09_20110 [Planctomycetota bacterium]
MSSTTATLADDARGRGLVSMPAVALIWIGAVLAVAMEAGARFQAPLITREVAFDVGRTVFTMFNRVEIVLAVLATILTLWQRERAMARWAVLVAVCALIVQTLVLLPALNARADVIIAGGDVAPDGSHAGYLAAEGIKLVALAVAAHVGLRGLRGLRGRGQ